MEISLAVPGRHNVTNALAAAAAAIAAGLSCEQVAAGLAAVAAEAGRLERRRIAGGVTLIDDSYNANPASVKAAIDVLMESDARRILVLGTMAELGGDSEALHAEVGRGSGSRSFDSREALAAALSVALRSGDVVLVKGSRSAGMESVVATLADMGEG